MTALVSVSYRARIERVVSLQAPMSLCLPPQPCYNSTSHAHLGDEDLITYTPASIQTTGFPTVANSCSLGKFPNITYVCACVYTFVDGGGLFVEDKSVWSFPLVWERVIDSTLILSVKDVSVPVCVLPWHVLLGCIFVKNQGCVDEFVVGKTFVSCQISVFVTVFCRVCPDLRRSFTTRAPDNRMVCTGHWNLL